MLRGILSSILYLLHPARKAVESREGEKQQTTKLEVHVGGCWLCHLIDHNFATPKQPMCRQSMSKGKGDSSILPEWYVPKESDVICSWARQNHQHGKYSTMASFYLVELHEQASLLHDFKEMSHSEAMLQLEM